MITEEQKAAPDFVEVEIEDGANNNQVSDSDMTDETGQSSSYDAGVETSIDLKFDGMKDGIRLIAAYHFVWSGLMVLGIFGVSIPIVITAIVGVTDNDPEVFIATAILGIVAFVLVLLATIYGVVGYGLWKRRQWARTAAIALGILSLPAIPIGTLGGGATLWYLLQERVARTFN